MKKPIRKLQRAVLAVCWLGAGASCTSDPETPSESPAPEVNPEAKTVCATFSMAKGQSSSVEVKSRNVQLRIPSTLEMQGKMSGGVIFVDFDRPKYGNLACRYEPGEDGALTLKSC